MKTLSNIRERVIKKYGTPTNTTENIVNAPAIETTEQHRYTKNLQEVIVREDHDVQIRHIVQPITDEVVRPHQNHHRHRPAQFREVMHAYADEDVRQTEVNEQQMTEIGQHTVLDDVVEEVSAEPVVSDRQISHTVEVVQPVIQRRVLIPHVIHETIPVFEKHVRYSKVGGVHTLPPITFSEWMEHKANNSTTEPTSRHAR